METGKKKSNLCSSVELENQGAAEIRMMVTDATDCYVDLQSCRSVIHPFIMYVIHKYVFTFTPGIASLDNGRWSIFIDGVDTCSEYELLYGLTLLDQWIPNWGWETN